MSYTLTPKSQVTLPKPIRDFLKVAPGDAVDFEICADGSVRVVPARVAERTADPAAARPTEAELFEKYMALRGTAGTGRSTEEWMNLLRGYDEDAGDPGFAEPPK